ncbi:hypothetical protein BDY24DRAFT_403268 [Mrakia frigida]|uniref:uncharacterized protein n=1 Tax=Mrakia frigida TaxID=29902 RepID=UPI003FCC2296
MSSSSSSSSHKIKVDSYNTNTHQVTLYAAAHTAQVQRRFEVALKPGKTDIDIENLPNGVEEDTLRVEGYGDDGVSATIVDAVCLPLTPKPIEKESSEIVELRKKISFKNKVLESIQAQENILLTYSSNLTPSNTPASELSSYLSLSSSKSLELAQSRTKTDEEIQALETELDVLLAGKKEEQEEKGKSVESRERRKADELLGRRRRTVRVLVEVEGSVGKEEEQAKEVTVNVVLIYVVRGAGWSPIYDIRANTAPSPTSPTNEKSGRSYQSQQKVPLSIHYRSSITNATGEPWINTQIVLSTASPLVGSTIPTLQPYRLGFPHPMLHSRMSQQGERMDSFGAPQMAYAAVLPPPPAPGNMMKRTMMSVRSAQVGGGGDDEGRGGGGGFAQRSAEVEGTGATMSAVFRIDGRSDIECDGGAHKVSIAVLKLDAELSHITVPSAIASAFLQASVKNASPYPLLPGPTTIYLDGSLVGRGRMGDVSPEETFKVSLGVDGAVRITFHPEEKFKTTSGGILSSKTENVSFVQKVTVENTKPLPVTILIQSRFPISEDQKIIVRLVHPSSSLPAQDSDGQGGVTRWVEGKREEGMIEWSGKVGAREKKIWKYGWEVEGAGWVARPH